MAFLFQHYNFFALWHPEVMLLVIILLVVYFQLLGPLKHRFGENLPPVPTMQKVYFISALVVFYLAMGTPLKLIADDYLFSGHMVQYALLSMVLPPLLLAGIPQWMIQSLWKTRFWYKVLRVATNPPFAIITFNVIFSAIEWPPFLDASLRNDWVYVLESYVMLFSAIFMWWPVMSPVLQKGSRKLSVVRKGGTLPELGMISRGYQLVYIFFNFDLMMPALVYIIDTTQPFYQFYIHAPRIFGISALADQQLGVLIMGLSMTIAYISAFIATYTKYDESHWYE
ncbi:putative membrane protein [Sulfobacillus thermosulfidooxidans DSM 9293]|uniref:Putative membrane protein n=1 Tax=Sulfobacillus thermosulfidooxidans (strain DSM 9293 / VKM B-1269 / AT-1) TaxID=929705 RepID=A0A1W1W7G0_SULTA|nr:cytochrome c oxidase assembly protein [Sulfobacillus thermosulfidooxidans]SMC02224.1 putative membrane protein [Sulfobacillus thermosulfidooxidans DSM 9293]